MNTMRSDYITYKAAPIPLQRRQGVVGISRLMNAALIDNKFCDLLLSNPTAALMKGFQGEDFQLSPIEREFVLTARAGTLQEFAAQWIEHKSQISWEIREAPIPVTLRIPSYVR